MEFGIMGITLAIALAMLAMIIYMLRIFILMERRIARIEKHTERMLNKIFEREKKVIKKMN